MLTALRTCLYAVMVLGGLSFLTYHLYFSPGTMERRASAELGTHLRDRPRVRGARRQWLGPLEVREIEFPARPVIDRRHLLLVQGIEAETGDSLHVRARKAELSLDHELVPDPSGAAGSRWVWNFRDVLRDRRALAGAAKAGHRASVEQLMVELQAVRRRREKSVWGAAVEDLVLEGRPDGSVAVKGDLASGSYWSEGQFSFLWWPDPGAGQPALTGQVTIENLQGLDEWLGTVFSGFRRWVALLSPRGPVTLQVASMSLQDDGAFDYRAAVRHYDSTLRLSPWEVEVRHTIGAASLEPAGVVLGRGEGKSEREGGGEEAGEKEKEAGLSGEIWGAPVVIGGRITPSSSLVQVILPEVKLETASVSAQPEALRSLWRRLRPSGSLSGSLDLRFGDGPLLGWRLGASFEALALADLPFLGAGSGTVTLRAEGEVGSGVLFIAAARCEPLGDLHGSIPISWTAREVTLEPGDLFLGGGRLYGKLTRASVDGGLSGSIRLEHSTVNYGDGLLTAASASGKVDLSPEGGTARLDLGGVRLVAELLPKEGFPLDRDSLEFAEGEILVKLPPGGPSPLSLALRGEGCALRLQGSIGPRGDLDAVAVLAVGEEARALNILGTASAPREWRRAVSDRALAMRARGGARGCRLRKVSWSDAAFEASGG